MSELLEQVKVLDEVGLKPFELRDMSSEPSDSSSESAELIHKEMEEAFLCEYFLSPSHIIAKWKERSEILRLERSSSKSRLASNPVQGPGRIIHGDIIRFENVTLVNPDGRVLVTGTNTIIPLH